MLSGFDKDYTFPGRATDGGVTRDCSRGCNSRKKRNCRNANQGTTLGWRHGRLTISSQPTYQRMAH